MIRLKTKISFDLTIYNSLRKNFKKLPKDHTKLQKKHKAKVIHFLKENPQVCDAYEIPEIQRTKFYLENERISKDKYVLLKNFPDLENKLSSLQKDLKVIARLNNILKIDMILGETMYAYKVIMRTWKRVNMIIG